MGGVADPPPPAFPQENSHHHNHPPDGIAPHAFPPAAQPVNFPPHQPNMGNFQPSVPNFPPNQSNMGSFQSAVPNFPPASAGANMHGPPFNQNVHISPIVVPSVPWSSSLFDCCDDPESALITFCVPCVTFGQVAEIVDQGQTSCATSAMFYSLIWCCIGCPCLISFGYRTKLRSRFNLIESPAPDWILHCLCDCCAICQEYRELKSRGFDPAIGWIGNVNKMQNMQGQVAMTPPMHHMMGR